MEGVNLTRACHATGEFVRSIEKRDVLVSLALISVAGLLAAAVAGAARRFGLSGGWSALSGAVVGGTAAAAAGVAAGCLCGNASGVKQVEKREGDLWISRVVLGPQLDAEARRMLQPRKSYFDECVRGGREVDDVLTFTRYETGEAELKEVSWNREEAASWLQEAVTSVEGGFNYPSATDDVVYYTANFAHDYVGNVAYQDAMFAQDEYQTSEHPAMYRLTQITNSEDRELRQDFFVSGASVGANAAAPYRVGIVRGAKRYAEVDSRGIYGRSFEQASYHQLQQAVKPIAEPSESPIIEMMAPPFIREGNAMTKNEVMAFLGRAYTAGVAAKAESPGKEVVICTGKWGCGAFGCMPKASFVAQLCGFFLAGVKVQVHPYDQAGQAALEEAKALMAQVPQGVTNADQLCDWLVEQGFVWGQGNGT